jgi:hypothetical protein
MGHKPLKGQSFCKAPKGQSLSLVADHSIDGPNDVICSSLLWILLARGKLMSAPSLLNRKYNLHLVFERKHNLYSTERKHNLHSAKRKHNLHLITYIHRVYALSSTKNKHTQSSCITYIHRVHTSSSTKAKQKYQGQQKLNN